MGYPARLPGFKSQLCQAVWSWETDLVSLCLPFLFKMGSIIIPGNSEWRPREYYAQGLQTFSATSVLANYYYYCYHTNLMVLPQRQLFLREFCGKKYIHIHMHHFL